jgi:F420-dependent oxidoreductase-like protein
MASHPIRFGVQTGQQLVEWQEICGLWEKVDRWGYDSLWTFDHFYPIFHPDPAGPCMEGWTTLTALSQHTSHARIGAMVNGNSYRNPCLTAKMAATLDQVSGGRFNLGIGAGWFELEHRSFGIEFKPIGSRLRALDESLQIIKGMFTQEKTTLHGKHYRVTDAVCNPKPLHKPHPPILIGGSGENVLLNLVAKHADMWNKTGGSAEEMHRLIEIIQRHGDIVGRDTDEIEKTIMIQFAYRSGKERETMVINQVAAMFGRQPDEVRKSIMVGDKAECLDRIERYVKAGVTHFIFSMRAPYPAYGLQRFAEEVIPQVRAH